MPPLGKFDFQEFNRDVDLEIVSDYDLFGRE